MDKIILEKLHYFELKEKVKSYCVSGLGKELIDKLEPSSSMKTVKNRLDETSEGRRLLDASYHIPLKGISNVTPLVDKIDKGAALEAGDLTKMSDFLRGCSKVKQFMVNKEGYAPTLNAYANNIFDMEYIEEEINRCIKGNSIDSSATKELKKIRRHIEDCESKIKERLEKFLKSSVNKEYIQDFFVTERNGRYTIPIKAAYKNQVQGNIIDVSPKGTTVFVEPSSVSKYTSELSVLKVEESVEEYKILSELTQLLFDRLQDIRLNIEVIAQYDMIWAKAKYSAEIGGIQPKLNNYGYIKIVKGKYPLIENVVPLDFEIGKDYRSLIITGPNAGGKTVVLKTIGLLTLAVQSGLHIACDEGTEMAVFNKIFVEIGDNQSVENALSTFSSHVKNIAQIIRDCDKSTLLLFDEIGSGTEPNEGAALAIAILEDVYHRGCITVATTHYGEIKNFSKEHPDFENAAMEFRPDTLDPLYKLHIGKSGASNALYISKKMGIPDNIIEKTKKYIENKSYDMSLVSKDKIMTKLDEVKQTETYYEFEKGDRVTLLELNKPAIVYEKRDKNNNVKVLYDSEFIDVNYKRLKLELRATELYPEGYDLNQLFVSFKERKLERDIERGSKKALKKLQKERRERDKNINNM